MARHVSLLGFLQDVVILCLKYNGSVTSWIRSEKRNTEVGGIPGSLHLVGYAVDIAFDTDADRAEALKFIVAYGYQFSEYTNHVHVEYDPS